MPTLKMTCRPRDLITIELKIGGRLYDFIVDSGCTMSMVIPPLVPELSDHQKARTWHGKMDGHAGSTVEPVMPVIFNLIGVNIRQIAAASEPVLKIGNSISSRFGGLVGLDVLERFRSVEFDFQNRVIRFTPYS